MRIKHIDVDQGRVDQDAREVKTKFSKSFATWFFPVGNDACPCRLGYLLINRQPNADLDVPNVSYWG
jgi:hypothetical protein